MSDIWWHFDTDKMTPTDREELYAIVRKHKKEGHAKYEDRDAAKKEKPKHISTASKIIPNHMMIRIGKLYGRRDSTQWSKKEAEAYNDLKLVTAEDMDYIERYHAEMAKKPKGEDYRRRDLQTLLNNFYAELDRARNYQYTLFQDVAAGKTILAPKGWKVTFEKICGNEPFLEWNSLTPDTKKEIIEYKE